MIVSHRFKFIFIKTKKTAGTSIEVFLSQYCGDVDIVTPIYPHVEPHVARNYKGLWNPIPELVESRGNGLRSTLRRLLRRTKFNNHMTALAAKNRLPTKVWEDYFKFCVERNPWDKTLSQYHMMNDREGGTLSFDQYIKRGNFPINYYQYTDMNGRVILDRIIKYELLNEELAEVFGNLNVPFGGELNERAKSHHRVDRRPYQDVYNHLQKTVIEEAFAREIELLGYSF
jgi:hypothetical protein